MTAKKRKSSATIPWISGLIGGLLLVFGLCINGYAALPGFVRTEAPLVSPKKAAEIIAAMAPKVKPLAGDTIFGATGINASSASSELAALARGLKSDVDIIYRYVHDHVCLYTHFWLAQGSLRHLS